MHRCLFTDEDDDVNKRRRFDECEQVRNISVSLDRVDDKIDDYCIFHEGEIFNPGVDKFSKAFSRACDLGKLPTDNISYRGDEGVEIDAF